MAEERESQIDREMSAIIGQLVRGDDSGLRELQHLMAERSNRMCRRFNPTRTS